MLLRSGERSRSISQGSQRSWSSYAPSIRCTMSGCSRRIPVMRASSRARERTGHARERAIWRVPSLRRTRRTPIQTVKPAIADPMVQLGRSQSIRFCNHSAWTAVEASDVERCNDDLLERFQVMVQVHVFDDEESWLILLGQKNPVSCLTILFVF